MIDARLLQLCDSAFPSGAFSQSFGLETAILERGMTDAAGVHDWIAAYLADNLATLDARAFVLGFRNVHSVPELDDVLAASVFASDVRSANRRLARATLEAYGAMGIVDDEIQDAAQSRVIGGIQIDSENARKENCVGHLKPAHFHVADQFADDNVAVQSRRPNVLVESLVALRQAFFLP